MRRRAVPLLALLLVAVPCLGDAASPDSPAPGEVSSAVGGVAGTVSAVASQRLADVSVYAYEVAELTAQKALTDEAGRFLFEELPAGIYKLIAYKSGFEPTVVMLSRAAAGAQQFVDLRLREESADTREGESYWSVRERIPPDILRDIRTLELASMTAAQGTSFDRLDAVHGSIRARTGYDDLAGIADAYISGAGIDMQTAVGHMELDVTGDHVRLEQLSAATGTTASAAAARATTVGVALRGAGEGTLDLTTFRHSLLSERVRELGETDFERYRLSWTQPVGERSRSRFSAQYTEESNYFRRSSLLPVAVPDASRQLHVEGAYQMEITDRTAVEAGVRYRQRQGESTGPSSIGGIATSETVELFGRSGWHARPSVLVEYGLYTELEDGSYSLAPQGSLVLQLADDWQATTTASVRVEEHAEDRRTLAPVRTAAVEAGCDSRHQHCVEVVLAYEPDGERAASDGGEGVTFAAIHREVADALQLYFGEDPLQRESLYLTEGDELPEIRLVASRRITPQILARLETSAAEGGGGLFYVRGKEPFENRVRYFVTALDTRFQRTSTGIFVAFHHLEQALEAQRLEGEPADEAADMELERLQLMLSQDLGLLATLAADWAVHLNVELSRGALPFSLVDESFDEMRRQVTGGISVRF